jgi:hypothetical protein
MRRAAVRKWDDEVPEPVRPIVEGGSREPGKLKQHNGLRSVGAVARDFAYLDWRDLAARHLRGLVAGFTSWKLGFSSEALF